MSEGTSVDDVPYRAEYSKSGRASCRGCKSQIAKDTLRLAVLVQSPMFDGKVPHWYHFMCFFGKQRPKTVGDIAHYESLRWDDQEKIKNKIESLANAPVVAPKGKGKKRASGASTGGLGDFTIEYSKSSRATCRGCEQKIMKEEVRISKKDFETDVGKRYGGQDMWHHVECFSKLRATLGFWESGSALPGFNSLKKEDKKVVEGHLPKIKPIKKEEDEADGPSPPKKVKEDPNAEERKKQNKLMFKYRDSLKNELSKKDMSALLEYNDQEIPVGEEVMLDRLSDIMTFGALKPCALCKGGQFVFRSGVGYQCCGDLTEWSKCSSVVDEPQRKPFKVPSELAETYSFLSKYKYKPLGKRLFEKTASKAAVKKEDENAGPKVFRPPPPLQNMEFVLGSSIKKEERKALKERIAKLGGKVVSKVSSHLAAVITTQEDVEKMGVIVTEAQEKDIQVVEPDFLDEVEKTPAADVITKKSISDWGSDVKSRLPDVKHEPKKSKSGSMFTKSMPSKVKLRLKGGTAVDPDSGLEDVAHVYQKDKDIYAAVLGITDIQSGRNSYYKLQLLASDHGNRHWCFRSWGRIGTTIGGNKLSEGSLYEMLQEFKATYEEKSGNMWEDRHNFVKVPGKMYPVDVDYSDGNEEAVKVADNGVPSKLAPPVQDLVQMLFDVNQMKKVMQEFELDMEKMPLGKLSKRQLQQALQVLTDLQELVKGSAAHAQFIDASNRFYTLIPHDFGVDVPPVINTQEMIKQKLEMVESLMEMEVAYSLLKSSNQDSSSGDINVLDSHYTKLKTDIEVLDKNSEEFEMLKTYIKNTHGATHTSYELEVLEVFKVKRHGEDKRYKPFRKLHNRKLLWHGSRLTNFAGILSQGLRIAPPEAPVTGYMFGKGIYFADMVSKSANYCCTSPQNPIGLMLLSEVALGNMYERHAADYIEKLPKNFHSCKGVGRTEPDPEASKVLENGVEVPLGQGKTVKKANHLSLFYNEYIVYDVAQVNVQYLLKMDFKYKY